MRRIKLRIWKDTASEHQWAVDGVDLDTGAYTDGVFHWDSHEEAVSELPYARESLGSNPEMEQGSEGHYFKRQANLTQAS